jgi:hypothetical protein
MIAVMITTIKNGLECGGVVGRGEAGRRKRKRKRRV